MRNNITHVFYLVVALLGVMLALHFLPALSVGGTELQQVDMLSELRPEEAPAPLDTLPVPPRVFSDSCKPGVVCIEDYGTPERRAMDYFYEALDKAGKGQGTVRIAFLGDSFIEGDILTSDLRDLLQAKYGGQGTGFLNIRSVDENYRPTVRKRTSGFTQFSARDPKGFDFGRSGLSGYYCTGGPGSTVFVSGRNARANRNDLCARSSLYFKADGPVAVTASVNDGPEQSLASTGRGVQELHVDGSIGTVRWRVKSAAPSTVFYGVAMDGASGIGVDNYSLRASTGYHLASLSPDVLTAYDACRHYDLIVLQYGLNIASKEQKDYSQYEKSFRRSLDLLMRCFPRTSFLVVSVGDRDYRASGGTLKTMPGILAFIRAQQKLAGDAHVAFWNTFQAMGGEGSISRWAAMKPPRANLDYTHINFEGGRAVAASLFDALVWGKEEYDRRTGHHPGADGN